MYMYIVHRMSHTHIVGLQQHSSYVILSKSELCVDQEGTLQICSTYENSSANKLPLKPTAPLYYTFIKL